MKILVTGSSGLIGKWVIETCLDNGFEVVGFDNRPCPYEHYRSFCILGDIRNIDQLQAVVEEHKPDVILHLAARIDLEGKTLQDYDSNTLGVENVCNVAKSCPSVKRLISTSSMLVCKVGYVPEDEHDYCPNTVYGESKVETERITKAICGDALEWCLARPTTVWGPYMSDHYKSLLTHIRRGTYFHSGNDKLYKSYSFAANIAFQYLQLITASRDEVNKKTFYMAD